MLRYNNLSFHAYVMLFSLLLVSCHSRPDGILSDREMADLMVDLELAQAYSDSRPEFRSDSMKKVLRQTVMQDHHITQDQLDKNMDWYGSNMEKYVELQDKVTEKLKKQLAYLNNSGSNEEETSEWPFSQMFIITKLSHSDSYTFSMSGEKASKGDMLSWMGFIDEGVNVKSLLGVEYSDSTISYISRNLSQGRFETILQTDSTRSVKKIFGYIKNETKGNGQIKVDSLSFAYRPLNPDNYRNIRNQIFYNPIKKESKNSKSNVKKDSLSSGPRRII